MKKFIPYIAVILIFVLLVSCALKKPNIIGNVVLIKEIARIEQLSVMNEEGNNNLTVNDLQPLEELTQGDEIAEDYVAELKWLIEHNEGQHLLHETSFIREYIDTGKEIPCVPHELWHISVFIKHGDMDYAEKQLKDVEEGYDAWVKDVEAKRKSYPQFYHSLDQLEQMSRASIEKLKQNDYSNKTLDQLNTIGAAAVC